MAPIVITALVTVLLGAALLHSYLTARRLARCTWDELVGKLHPVESAGVMTVALNHLVPQKDSLNLEPEEMWNLMGGLEGVQRMRENGRILIALASYVERWNFDEGSHHCRTYAPRWIATSSCGDTHHAGDLLRHETRCGFPSICTKRLLRTT